MKCPKCQWNLKYLGADDDIAQWVCWGCGDFWTTEFLDNLTDAEELQMHIDHLNHKTFLQNMYDKKKEPVKIETKKEILTGGLMKWIKNA